MELGLGWVTHLVSYRQFLEPRREADSVQSRQPLWWLGRWVCYVGVLGMAIGSVVISLVSSCHSCFSFANEDASNLLFSIWAISYLLLFRW